MSHRLALVLVLMVTAACGLPELQQPETATVQLTGTPVAEPAIVAPPDAERQWAGMFLSHGQVGSAGQLVALAMTPGVGDDTPEYGVVVDLQRWNGGAWAFLARATTGLTGWARPGQVHLGVDPATVAYEGIGVSAPPGQAGPVEWVALPGLEPGWYRFTRPGGSAAFEVVSPAAAVGPDLRLPDSAELLDVQPAIASVTETVRLIPHNGPRLAEGDVLLESWDGDRWTQAALIPADVEPVPVLLNSSEAAVLLPELRAGAHRVTATDDSGRRRVGHMFVVVGPDATPAVTASAVPPPPTPQQAQGCGYGSVAHYAAPEELTPEDAAEVPLTAHEAVERLRVSAVRHADEAADFLAAMMRIRADLYAQLAPQHGSADNALFWTADDGQGAAVKVTLMHYGPGYVVEYEEATFPAAACPPEGRPTD